MAHRPRRLSVDEDTSQPAVKRQKISSESPVTASRQPSVSRHKRTIKDTPSARVTAVEQNNATQPLPRPSLKVGRTRQARRKPKKPKGPDLLSLPLELKQHIFSYTTARDTPRLRQVCKTFYVAIRGYTKQLAKIFYRRELARLQQCVDDWKSLEAPTDFDSLIEAVHVWTKRRGTFWDESQQIRSMQKLMAHLFMGRQAGLELGMSVVNWSWNCAIGDTEDFDKENYLEHLSEPGFFDYIECDKVFECIKHPELQARNHRIEARVWGYRTKELATFPEQGRMTPLLQYPCNPGFDTGDDIAEQDFSAFVDYLHGTLNVPLLNATHGNPQFDHYLGLPQLPDEVSCFFLDSKWAQDVVKKILDRIAAKTTGITPVCVPLLVKAAILSEVVLF